MVTVDRVGLELKKKKKKRIEFYFSTTRKLNILIIQHLLGLFSSTKRFFLWSLLHYTSMCLQNTFRSPLSPQPNGPARSLLRDPSADSSLPGLPSSNKTHLRRGKSIPKSLWTLFQRHIEIPQNNKKLILHHVLPLT